MCESEVDVLRGGGVLQILFAEASAGFHNLDWSCRDPGKIFWTKIPNKESPIKKSQTKNHFAPAIFGGAVSCILKRPQQIPSKIDQTKGKFLADF